MIFFKMPQPSDYPNFRLTPERVIKIKENKAKREAEKVLKKQQLEERRQLARKRLVFDSDSEDEQVQPRKKLSTWNNGKLYFLFDSVHMDGLLVNVGS